MEPAVLLVRVPAQIGGEHQAVARRSQLGHKHIVTAAAIGWFHRILQREIGRTGHPHQQHGAAAVDADGPILIATATQQSAGLDCPRRIELGDIQVMGAAAIGILVAEMRREAGARRGLAGEVHITGTVEIQFDVFLTIAAQIR